MTGRPGATAVRSRQYADGPAAELTGTVSVITGGGRGIGRFLARALADAGSAVGLIARSEGELAETVRLVTATGGTAAAVCADITDPAGTLGAVDALRRRLGRPTC
jgi:NAD(P)-dependent dehydrogenase (short-subunit alcohol dehydrogenase family)